MTKNQAMTAETMIPSGSIPARSHHAYTRNQWDTSAVKFSGVRSSGQYCRPENLRWINDTIRGEKINGHFSLLGMGD